MAVGWCFAATARRSAGRSYRLPLKSQTVPDGDPIRLTATLNAGKSVWMPDGREILFAASGALWRLDAG